MNAVIDLFLGNNFTSTLVDSLPGGLLVVDENGRVQLVNNILERVLKVSKQTAIGKATGNVLGCLHVTDHPKGCGFGECCSDCEIQRLKVKTFATNQRQKAKANFKLIIDRQVRDLSFLLSAFPFTLRNASYCILIIENIGALRAFSPSETKEGFRGIVGCSPKIKEVFDTIRQVAPTDAAVLIQGESGTGKELAALAVHKESRRAHKNFVPVNCGALPEGLLETELFGHVKGAFTGAHRDRKGRFELADDGTIFLDEVGELSPATQAKLLRVLQGGSFEPVGSERTVQVNVRVISATNKKLEEEVEAGRFRRDLYYRLCVMPIMICPLRDRLEDIPFLVDHFLSRFAEKTWNREIPLSPAVLSIMMSHTWPGNVRELKNTIQFAIVKCQGRPIKPEHLPPTLHAYMIHLSTKRHRQSKLKSVDVIQALADTGGNKVQAAEVLSVSRSTLYRFLAEQENKSPAV